jgi:hypothetical protein
MKLSEKLIAVPVIAWQEAPAARHAACGMRHAACGMRHAACDGIQAVEEVNSECPDANENEEGSDCRGRSPRQDTGTGYRRGVPRHHRRAHPARGPVMGERVPRRQSNDTRAINHETWKHLNAA